MVDMQFRFSGAAGHTAKRVQAPNFGSNPPPVRRIAPTLWSIEVEQPATVRSNDLVRLCSVLGGSGRKRRHARTGSEVACRNGGRSCT